MGKIDWDSVKREDVEKAIRLFLSENLEYPSPRSTFLLYDGKRLPAKHIRGMAYKVANNIEVSKSDYAGGMETVRFFERLGFEVYYTGAKKQQPVAVLDREVSEERKTVPKKQVTVSKQKKNAGTVDCGGKNKIRIPSDNR